MMNQKPQGQVILVPAPAPWQGDYYPQQERRNEVPLRVQAAMAFLEHLTRKTQHSVAVNDISIEQVPGQALTVEEEKARWEALKLVGAYFAGTLRPTIWDRPLKRPPAEKDEMAGLPALKVKCLKCEGNPFLQHTCEVCAGMGYVRIAQVRP